MKPIGHERLWSPFESERFEGSDRITRRSAKRGAKAKLRGDERDPSDEDRA